MKVLEINHQKIIQNIEGREEIPNEVKINNLNQSENIFVEIINATVIDIELLIYNFTYVVIYKRI